MADAQNDRSTRELLVEVTARRLWSQDETELRILDICQETNLSTSVIYAHFRSRQGLIDAALLQNFAAVTGEMLDIYAEAGARVEADYSYVDLLLALLSDPGRQAAIRRQRQMFLRVTAAALARPSIRIGFLELHRGYSSRTEAFFDRLLEQHRLPEDLTSRQWALFFEGQMLSLASHDLTPEEDAYQWDDVVRRLFNAAGALDPL